MGTESTVLVTLAVGTSFERRWEGVCRPNWEAYAARHGYDVVCITEPLDTSARAADRSPAWQKCLVLSDERVRDYDRVVWVDADIVFNPDAPSVTEGVPHDKVGAVDEWAIPSKDEHPRLIRKLYQYWDASLVPYFDNKGPEEYYAQWGLPPRFDEVVQTGLMVLTPAEHRDLLEDTYARYDDRGPGWNYEMRPLSWELLSADRVAWIDHRFNYIWGLYKTQHFPHLIANPHHESAGPAIGAALADVYGLHFAGATDEMHLAVATPRSRGNDVPKRQGIAPRAAQLETPVALLVFNRPDTTRRVFDTIRQARPSTLLVVADAPRPDHPDDERLCREALAVLDVDWNCDVSFDVAERHLGPRARIVTGLNSVFERVERAVILEDDCVPDPTFFPFCEELLERYADDPQVMAISGTNLGFTPDRSAGSYAFTRYPLIWGWGTWRRAWNLFDDAMTTWPELRASRWLEHRFDDPAAVNYWTYFLQAAYEGMDVWDYQFLFACWVNDGLAAIPAVNLVSNIGFRADATHTKGDYRSLFAGIPAHAMTAPLRHPSRVEPEGAADAYLEDVVFSGNARRMMSLIRERHALRP